MKIKTSIANGEIVIPHQKFHNCEIPECLTIAKNYFALTTILNNTTKPVTLNFSQPISRKRYNALTEIAIVPRNHRNPWYDNVEEFRK
ncbi:unnamed protein product [Acanthoscelides obtectus]|uniref:Uncharacterized protein n=1 Tax=Acanthoscelides obtectus TaxID=200917 RepID=A0A9P0KWY9_ACAOB|nr:unnamed protein product [Acanthoscelides obtectus]CAK1642344.1 hypothetical protein AOBTE_LOCUS12988 [Acanthoscelides obtectus]